MNFKEFQKLAQRTSSTHNLPAKVNNGCLGLIGEAGEVVDIVKKYMYQGMPVEEAREKMVKEIGDVAWYCAELCTGIGEDLGVLMDSPFSWGYTDSVKYHSIPLKNACACLAGTACEAWKAFCNDFGFPDGDECHALETIPRILSICMYILTNFCGTDIETCLDKNIEKLRARYPDGFDADRSNHRNPGDN